jgi:hypothetical protein
MSSLDGIPDVEIKIRLKSTAEGGRAKIIAGKYYSCVLFIEGKAFDCRIPLRGKTFSPGQTYDIPVFFLNPIDALRKLSVGSNISLWEGRTIATGIVTFINEKPRSR